MAIIVHDGNDLSKLAGKFCLHLDHWNCGGVAFSSLKHRVSCHDGHFGDLGVITSRIPAF